MKKVFALLTAFVFVGLVACGPSAEDAKKIEEALQATADSAANALLQQASDAATEPVVADSAAVAVNPEHGAEGHVCAADCSGMKK